ncbi:MAG: glycosyltransferase [Sandaracinaceae bacterium]|nr:glycosyltransferase [Sandaracinaceae bacterium]
MSLSERLLRRLRASVPDVVVLVDTVLGVYAALWEGRTPFAIVAWEHFNLSVNHGSRLRTAGRVWAAWRADALVVLTERDAHAWREHRWHPCSARVIPNPTSMKPSVTTPKVEASPHVVLALGRLEHEKGYDRLMRAWSLLGSKRNGWLLRIVGEGSERQALSALAAELGVSDSVCLPGAIRDVAVAYESASIFAMTSRWEGLPMTLIEAQSFGLPAVAMDCETGPREILSGGGGILVADGDETAMARELHRLMCDGAARVTLAREAQLASGRFSPAIVTAEWLHLLESISPRPSGWQGSQYVDLVSRATPRHST